MALHIHQIQKVPQNATKRPASASSFAQPMAGAVRRACFAGWKFLIAIIALAGNGQGQERSPAGLEAKIRILEQQGIPTTSASLLERYHRVTSSADSNKWSNVFEQVEALVLQDQLEGEIPLLDDEFNDRFVGSFIPGNAWKAGPASVKFCEQHQKLLEQVQTLAVSAAPVRLTIVFEGHDTILPSGPVETMLRMVMVDALVAIDSRQADRVMHDIHALSKVANLMEPVPFLPLKFECVRLRRYLITAIQRAIEVDFLDERQLATLDRLLTERSDLGHRWKQLFDDEIAWNVPVLLDPHMAAQATGLRPQRFDPNRYIELTRRIGQLPCDDWNSFLKKCIDLEATFEKDAESAQTLDALAAYTLIASVPMVAHRLIDEAQLFRQARLAIAIRRYEHQQGTFPTTLAALPAATQAWTPAGSRPFGFMSKSDAALLWGFHVTPESLETPDRPPPPPVIDTASIHTQDIRWLLRK